MSLTDRARLAALVEADGDEQLRVHLLGAIGRAEAGQRARESAREVPSSWTMIHVLDRLEEAYAVLSSLPAKTRPQQFGNGMPTPVREKLTNKDWIDLLEAGELEKVEQDRNRVRLAPTTAQITRMDQALAWPFEFLRDQPELAKAISLRALWAVLRADIRKRCQQRGIDADRFNRQWQEGLRIITAHLVARRVPVT
jgi:hypothetical protein